MIKVKIAGDRIRTGGVLLTCSCSGALGREDFLNLAGDAIRAAGRECQILDFTGASPDHPVSPRCPETAYLKALWLRIDWLRIE